MNLKMTCWEIGNILCDDSVTVTVKCVLNAKTVDYLQSLGGKPVYEFYGTGHARYKEGDEQNLELGYQVARKKAIRQAYKRVENYLNDLLNQYESNYNSIFENFLSTWSRVEKLTDEIVELTRDDKVEES